MTGATSCSVGWENNMTNTQAWDYAVGMIKVDGLEPTEEFKKYIDKEKRGEVSMMDIKQYLDKKYKINEETENTRYISV